MICGEIYRWVTNQAIGHASRPKIQIFIGETGWPDDGLLFLMVNTCRYGADYPISVATYPTALTYDSFISCSGGPIYNPTSIAAMKLPVLGRLTKADCVGLRSQIIACGAMEQWMEEFCCGELAKFC